MTDCVGFGNVVGDAFRGAHTKALCFLSPSPFSPRTELRSRLRSVALFPSSCSPRRHVRMAVGGVSDRAVWANRISRTYDGSRYQFKDISLTIPVGAKIALLGANGVGKSSLLSVLAGQVSPDDGEVFRKKGLTLAMVTQDLPASVNKDESVLKAVLRLAGQYTSSPAVQASLRYATALSVVESSASEDASALAELSAASSAMEKQQDAWHVDSYMRNALSKLFLPVERRVGELSGGQQRRLALAAALVSKPDLLLLDEPTNHLSLEGIEFLEESLQEPSLTVICISHDRYFVDVFAKQIWELDGELHAYGPGYATFLDMKAQRIEAEEKEREDLLRTYKKELAWMRKQPKARGTKAKSREDNFRAMEEKLSRPKRSSGIQSLTATSTRLGGKAIGLKNVTLRRGDKLILEDFSYEFESGERIGICGGNGVGKSSILRAITAQLPLESGEIEIGETVKMGYFDQDGLDLPEDKRVIDFVREVASLAGAGDLEAPKSASGSASFEERLEAQIEELSYSIVAPARRAEVTNPLLKMSPIALLDQFGFERSQQHSFIDTLSGGERRRLQLLSLLLGSPNCMLLDECSNDIDIKTLSMLEDLLDDFKGTLVMVSHDRFMLDRLVNHLLVVEGDGSVRYYEGKFTDFLAEQKEAESEQKRLRQTEQRLTQEDRAQSRPKSKNKLSYKERKEYEKLEAKIAKAEEKHTELSEKLEKEAQSAGYTELAEWSEQIASLEKQIEADTERWLELAERVEG